MGLKLEGFAPFLLDPVELEVAPGEIVFLTGPSGSGKSLFLRALADLDVHQGAAWLDSTGMEDVAAPSWRRRIGYLTAESCWWSERVGDHFTRPDREQAVELGLPGEVFDWRVSRLSSGEKQRLALLRLLQQEPRALLLDERLAAPTFLGSST
ncbi:MAG: ATP-binding cassette domain-containing protein [Pseudomonadota bacterium]|nr:ATP-binding cassette domain-containing protein [Pseudomonadota bacterium]